MGGEKGGGAGVPVQGEMLIMVSIKATQAHFSGTE